MKRLFSARGRADALALVLTAQVVAAVFFLGDALGDLIGDRTDPHGLFEGLVALALIAGVALGAVQLRDTLARIRAQERALDTARGALAEVVERQFDDWGLTASERDVALLALKGLETPAIAQARGSAAGTVRAQLASVYAKAGVANRGQLVSWFLEDLLG